MPQRAVRQQRSTQRRIARQRKGTTRFLRNPSYRAGTVYSGTITNNGTLPSAPTISYTAPGSVASVYFSNVTAGKTVGIVRALVNTDVLSVDFATRTVTLNGTAITGAVSVDSRWWELAPGANAVRSNVPATVTHRDAYA